MKTAAFYVKLYYKQEFKIWKLIDFENNFLLSSHALKFRMGIFYSLNITHFNVTWTGVVKYVGMIFEQDLNFEM